MPSFVVLDTDVASLSFKGKLPPELARRLHGQIPVLSFVPLGEPSQWVELRR